jgi:hypothetical protein
MDMWKPFRNVTAARALQAAILYDKFHVMRDLGDALDEVCKADYRRLRGRDRSFIKGQKYTLLSRRENPTLDGRKALKKLLAANRRLNRAYLLKESFGQLWGYEGVSTWGHGERSHHERPVGKKAGWQQGWRSRRRFGPGIFRPDSERSQRLQRCHRGAPRRIELHCRRPPATVWRALRLKAPLPSAADDNAASQCNRRLIC